MNDSNLSSAIDRQRAIDEQFELKLAAYDLKLEKLLIWAKKVAEVTEVPLESL